MRRTLQNIFNLGIKELYGMLRDPVLLVLIVWAFSLGVLTPGKGAGDASLQMGRVAVVDEDNSALTRRIAASLYPPYFVPPLHATAADIDALMESGKVTFVIVMPNHLTRDVGAGDSPHVQLLVDATRMKQAGIGAAYIKNIINGQVAEFLQKSRHAPPAPVDVVTRIKFNPNLIPSGFQGTVVLLNNITILTIILTGAAVIRERENGTIEHALAMPVTSLEIMLGKIWANALVMLIVIAASLTFVARGLLGLTIAGSSGLLLVGVLLYLFAASSIGILLATIARTMPQMGLLIIMLVPVINMLSGNSTPIEAQPRALQYFMQLSPFTHFVRIAQGVIFRGATLADLWLNILFLAAIGMAVFLLARHRFRRSMAAARG